MNARGHHRVAARVLTALGMEPPAEWWSLPQLAGCARMRGVDVLPRARRPVGAPSAHRHVVGDGREPKYPDWATHRAVTPDGAVSTSAARTE